MIPDVSEASALIPARKPPAAPSIGPAQDFSKVIGRMNPDEMTPEQRAAEGAQQLVSVALVQPVLKSLRESNNAAGPFAPSQGERTFRGMMDATLAQRLVTGGHWGLVDHVARTLLSKEQGSAASKTAEPSADARIDGFPLERVKEFSLKAGERK